ncbi:MAG: hypothetical protein HY290_07670 [Planctomycetia bacterium]|nr:hypothetical protein [Planctomycetia bacterium]
MPRNFHSERRGCATGTRKRFAPAHGARDFSSYFSIFVYVILILAASLRADDQGTKQKAATETAKKSAAPAKKTARSQRRNFPIKQAGQQESAPSKSETGAEKEPAATYAPSDVLPPVKDPQWPAWTPTDNPARQPVVSPIGYYGLVRPPFGVAPDEYGQEYLRHVASEADLDFNDATCAQPIDIFRPDGVAPAGVIGDHTLNTLGRVMVSYRYNNMAYDGLLDGSSSISTAAALAQFPIVPISGTAQNHLFILEHAPTDDLTFQAILPIVQRRINYIDALGNRYVTDSTDISDIQLYALYVVQRTENQQIHLNLGVQAPTSVFDTIGQVPTPASPQLTYPMRIGDGTWDFLPGITYRGQSDDWTWGVQGLGIVRFGINRYGYRLGDEGNFNAWIARKLNDWASASTRLNAHVVGNIFGADERLNPFLVPSNMTSLQAGQQLNVLFGLNFVIPDGFLKGQRLGVEGGIPVYQWLEGPQLRQTYQIWTNLTLLF